MRPVALTVAGSDSGGGAGVQADLRAFAAHGAFGTSALTAVTAQHTAGVDATAVLDAETVRAQVDAVRGDFPVGAAKTGMLGDADAARAAADALDGADFPLVVDPVLVAASGARLLDDAGETVLRERLLPAARVVTPNAPEAAALTGVDVTSPEDAARAGHRLRETGADAALVTGGHLDGDPVDVLVTADGATHLRGDRVATDSTHGSGCTLSAALAAELAAGTALRPAVEAARETVRRALRAGYDYGTGPGPVQGLAGTRARAGVPETAARVRRAVRRLEGDAIAPVVPEVGLNVAALPPDATRPADAVALGGRLHRTPDGVRACGEVRRGGSDHLARLLVGLRRGGATVRAACNVRADDAVVAALDGETVTVDRREEPADAPGTMDWVAARTMADRDAAPAAVCDGGDHGKEPMVRLLGDDPAALADRVRALADAVSGT